MIWQDVRFAFRMLLKNIGATLVIVLSIALAIGGAGSAFTWLKAVWLNPLPGAADSARLLTMNASINKAKGYSTSYRDYKYFREHTSSFTGLIAYELAAANVTVENQPRIVGAGVVSDNYFDVLGVHLSGRGFGPQDTASPQSGAVVVISYNLCRDTFGSIPQPVGATIRVNAQPFTVIGIAPKGFQGAYGGIAEEIWIPASMSRTVGLADDPESMGVQIMGRLKPNTTFEQAQAETHVLAQSLAKSDPGRSGKWDEILSPLYRAERGIVPVLFPVMQIVMAITILVLLIANANVANLLLARASGRVGEMGIRLALGASRGRLLRQLFTESLVLAVLGGLVGLILAKWAASSLLYFLPPLGNFSAVLDLSLDWRVLLFCSVVTIFTGMLFGFAPALMASRTQVVDALRNGSRSVAGGRRTGFLRGSLVVGQVALSLIVLVTAALFEESIRSSLHMKTGFDSDNVLLTSYDTLMEGYSKTQSQNFYQTLIQNVQSNAGVVSVSATSFVPMRGDGGSNRVPISIPEYEPRADEVMKVVADSIAPGYLETMRIPLLAGREFTWQDRANSPLVAIINRKMAVRYWKTVPASLGRPFRIGAKSYLVAGVAEDIIYRRPSMPAVPSLYLCILQNPAYRLTLVVRTSADPFAALPVVRHSVHSLDENMPISRIESMQQSVRGGFADQGLAVSLLCFFGSIALILTAVGAYGVSSYFVSLQRRELSIRLAMGATPQRIVRLVFTRGLRLGLIGVGIGVLMGIGVARGMGSMIYGIQLSVPEVLVGCSLFLLGLIGLACYLPARRTRTMNPLQGLRYD